MVRLEDRYWLDKKGPADAAKDDDAAAASKEDLKYCESSSGPGHASWLDARRASAGSAADGPEIHEVVVTPDPPKRAASSAAPVPETLPPGEPGLSPRASARGEARAEPLDHARLRELDTLLEPQGAEELPDAAGLPRRSTAAPEGSVAALSPDERTLPNETVAPPNAASEAESMPAPPAGLPERPAPEGTAAALAPDDRPIPNGTVAVPKTKRAPDSLPPPPEGLPERHAPATNGPAIMPDAGTGKVSVDPLPALKRLLADADPRARARAADELGRRGTAAAAAVPALVAALKDRDRHVRASAALALGNLGSAADAAVPALVDALKRGPEEVAWSAAVALGRIGTPRARRAFDRYARQSAGDFLKREGRGTTAPPR
jgi:hypothetical protein